MELEIERIQEEKRALMRHKVKQQRLYEKIRQENMERKQKLKDMGGQIG